MAEGNTQVGTVTPHEKAEPGRRQRVVLSGRDGLPVKVLAVSGDGYGGVLTFDEESRRALEENTIALKELTEAILNQSSGSTGS